jgi:hypothetical protein
MRGTTRQLPAAFLALLALIVSGLVVVLGAAAPAQAAPPRVCGGALDTGTDKVVLLGLPATGGTGSPSYDGGYLAPAQASAWTDYSIEGDATTSNTVAVSFRQSGNNGPSLQFSAGQNSLGPLRLNNGGWAADGTVALPEGTLARGEQFHFRIDVSGQQVTVHVDDVQVAQYSRPWLPASGTVGVRVSGAETGTLDNLVVRSLTTDNYLYADDFDDRATGAAGATAAGWDGLTIAEVCTVADSPGDAYWIWGSDTSSVNNWAAFRTTFDVADVDGLPATVNARIAAETKYWLHVNGELVVFEGSVKRGPNRQDSYVDNVDLRPYLRDGVNTIAILAVSYGRGGYAGPYSGRAGLFFEAADIDVRSDDTWKAQKVGAYGSMSVDTNYRLAEPNVTYDARQELAGWSDWTSADFDDSAWPAAVTAGNEGSSPWNVLVDNPIPLLKFEDVTAIPVTDPRVKTTSSGGVTTYELRMPVNHQLTPWVKLGAGTQAGRTVGLKTDHATVRGSGVEQAVQAEYVTKGGAQDYESLVWMNGDKLFITAQDGAVVEEIGYRLSGYDTDFDGSFSSDDPYMDKLWRMARDTLYVTMRDSYMDCPDRERSQWWGDAINEFEEGFYALDPAAADLGRKGISNVMGFRNGDLIPTQAPAAAFSELPAQSMAGVMSFWMFYEYSGDESVLDETYQPSVAYLRTYDMDTDGLLKHDHGGTWHWHDWGYNEDGRLIDTLWYYIALQATLKSGAELGKGAGDADMAFLEARATSIRDNIDKLWVPGKGFYDSTGDGRADDRANALAVYAGLAKPSQYEQIRDVLVKIKKSSPYMDKYVLEALYLMGYPDDAMARMKDRYAPMVNDPDHSTLWEFFAGPEQDAAGTFNHAWTGGPLTMMSRYAAGIQQVEPGFTEFAVRPQLGTMKQVSADVHSVNGEIAVSIDATDRTTYDLDVTVPTGTVAQVHLPTGELDDATIDGQPLSEDVDGVLEVTVDERAGETVARVEAGDHAFAVASAPATVSLPRLGAVHPGQQATSRLTVENTGASAIDSITADVEVPGLTEPVTLTGGPVAVGSSVELPFGITVPQGARHGASFDATADVTVSYGSRERTTTTTVSNFAKVTADVVVDSVVLGDRVGAYPATGQWTATATLRNNGTSPVNGRVVARSVADVLEGGAPSRLVTVPAGGSLEVPVTVHGGGRHWLPIMQPVTVDLVDRGSVVASGTSTARVKWYGPQGEGWNATGAGAVQGATDFVDLGDGGTGSTGNSAGNVRPGPTELAHNLRWSYQPTIPVGGTNTEGGLTRRFTWSRDGSWFSVDMDVESGEPFVLTMRETADTSVASTVEQVQRRPKAYEVIVDDVLVQQVKYLVPNEGVVGNTLANYQVLVDDPAALDADGDGTVTVKYLYRGGNDAFYDASLTDVWLSPAPAAVADDRAPTASAAPADDTTYGDNGWITAPTTLEVTAVDDTDAAPSVRAGLDGAPLTTYVGPVAVGGDGTHVLTYVAEDAAGNTSGDQQLTVKIDATKPVPSFGSFPSGTVKEGEVPEEPACQATDATSGIASCVVRGYSTEVGEHTLTQVVVDKAGNRAIATLSYEVVGIGKSALGAALDRAAALEADDWTTSTWAALRAVIGGDTGAQAVFDGTTFTEEQVQAATTAVTDAVAALAERGDPTALATLLAAGHQVEADLSGYTDASANAFRAALAGADAVHQARDDRTQTQLDAATTSLRAALDGLVAKPAAVDRSVLQRVHDQARSLSNADGRFTADSWRGLQVALEGARMVLADDDATQAEVDAAAAELTAAVASLALVPVVQPPIDAVPVKVMLNQKQLRLAKGQSLRLEEGVYDADGGASHAGKVVWTSSNERIATVSHSGVVKARKPGKVTVRATTLAAAPSGKALVASIKVRVVRTPSKAKVTRVRAAVPRSIQVGEAVHVTGTYAPASATKVKVAYRSSKPAVATVDAAGRIVAVKKGKVEVVIRAGGASRTYVLRVR